MSKRPKFREYSYAICDTRSRLSDHASEGHGGRKLFGTSGMVRTPDGVVEVYSQPGPSQYSSYETVVYGRVYVRTEPVNRSHRGLAIMAGRFMRDVVKEAYS